MKSVDEQLNIILQRSEIIKQKTKADRAIVGYGLAIAACLAVMVVSVFFIGKLKADTSINEMSRYGSLIISGPYIGYVIIGVLAFVLGILITLLCKHIYDLKKFENTIKDK